MIFIPNEPALLRPASQAAEGEVAACPRVAAREELADRRGELGEVQEAVAVEVEPAEGPGGLLGAGPVRAGEPRVLRDIEHPVAVAVGHLDKAVRGGADRGVEAGPVL